VNRRYALWLIVSPLSFEDRRVWRESKNSDQLQTRFQRAVGVRYVGKGSPRYSNAKGGVMSFTNRPGAGSVRQMLKGIFSTRALPRHRVQLHPGHSQFVPKATGLVFLSAPQLRPNVPAPGVRFVGTVTVRELPDA
jgi:hypothetical protein